MSSTPVCVHVFEPSGFGTMRRNPATFPSIRAARDGVGMNLKKIKGMNIWSAHADQGWAKAHPATTVCPRGWH